MPPPLQPHQLLLLLLLLLLQLIRHIRAMPHIIINEIRALPIRPMRLIANTLIRLPLPVIPHGRLGRVHAGRGPIFAVVVGEEGDAEGAGLGAPVEAHVVGGGGVFEAVPVVVAGVFDDGFAGAETVVEGADLRVAGDALFKEGGDGGVGGGGGGEGEGGGGAQR